MPTELNFNKNQSRKYFNVHLPVSQPFDDRFTRYNVVDNKHIDIPRETPKHPEVSTSAPSKNNPLSQTEVNRQTGTGKFYIQPVKPKIEGMGRFADGIIMDDRPTHRQPFMPHHTNKYLPMYGKGHNQHVKPMRNNFDPSAPAPIDKEYIHMPQHAKTAFTATIGKIPDGGSFAPLKHLEKGNPAQNNWKPQNVKEPNRAYQRNQPCYRHDSLDMQFRKPIIRPRFGKINAQDGVPLQSTAQFYNRHTQITNNPLRLSGI